MTAATRNGIRKEDGTVFQNLDEMIWQQKEGINTNKPNKKKKVEALRRKKNLV